MCGYSNLMYNVCHIHFQVIPRPVLMLKMLPIIY